jgi:diadenosine tetraphosphate (Ap4A) HIT family hydrolase
VSPADCPLCQKLAALDRLPEFDVVWQFPNSVALLGPWQYYHGYCVLVARKHTRELSGLANGERQAYLEEMCVLAAAIEACFQPHKLNYELLGNQVAHPHWHLFPRSKDDPETLKPVWIALDRAERDAEERRRLETGPESRTATANALRQHLRRQGAATP